MDVNRAQPAGRGGGNGGGSQAGGNASGRGGGQPRPGDGRNKKKGARVVEAAPYVPGMVPNDHRLRTKNLPATGGIVRDLEVGEQLQL